MAFPDNFMLFLSNNGAVRRACRVVWRNERQIGVKFETALGHRHTGHPRVEFSQRPYAKNRARWPKAPRACA
jgi:hypothetical protein